ncbi:MAG: omptin family outer membrane protease [Treponema sp.]|nr:omptin family outer membrane protease [Treponema sp.]
MKKRFFTFFAVFFFLFDFFALDSQKLAVKFTQKFELMNGQINEYVFERECLNTNNKLSELDWDIKNIPVFSAKADFDIKKYIHLDISCAIGIAKESGDIQDFDWLNSVGGPQGNFPEWKKHDPTELTNYSKHDNFLDQYMVYSLCFGANIYLPAKIKITPFLQYQYNFISFTGTDGYRTYKDDLWQKKDFSGKIISYKQESHSMLAGFKVELNTIPHLRIYSDFAFSPAMTFLSAYDYHYQIKTCYYDYFMNIWQLKSNLELQFKFNEHHALALNGALQFIPLSKGLTFNKPLDSEGNVVSGLWNASDKNDTLSGTKRFLWTIGLSYSFSL